jgi:hypothetical protein
MKYSICLLGATDLNCRTRSSMRPIFVTLSFRPSFLRCRAACASLSIVASSDRECGRTATIDNNFSADEITALVRDKPARPSGIFSSGRGLQPEKPMSISDRRRRSLVRHQRPSVDVMLCVFDLLELKGQDMQRAPDGGAPKIRQTVPWLNDRKVVELGVLASRRAMPLSLIASVKGPPCRA